MSIKEELVQYCNWCITGKKFDKYNNYLSCKKHIQACRRFLKDLEASKSDDFPYFFDNREAEIVVKFFGLLKHSKGKLAGESIQLTLWQKFIVCQLEAWRLKEDSRIRRFNKSFVEVARKNSKSQLESGLALYEMSIYANELSDMFEVYSAGVKRDQSKIVFDECRNMLLNSPVKNKFNITRDKITHLKSGSFMRPLNAEDSKTGDGVNNQLTILDEYHLHKDTSFYDLHTSGCKARISPMLCVITTAGFMLQNPCYTQEYPYCAKILSGEMTNDRYFIDILELDEGDEINSTNIVKANPIVCSYEMGYNGLIEDMEVAKQVPEKMVNFKTKNCNIWVSHSNDANKYIDTENVFDPLIIDELPYDKLEGKQLFVGVDLSSKWDLTSLTYEIPLMDDEGNITYYIKNVAYVPNEESVKTHEASDHMPYSYWHEQGWVKTTDSPTIDYKVLVGDIIDFTKRYGLSIKCVSIDTHMAGGLIADLNTEGLTIFECFQGPKSLFSITNELKADMMDKKVVIERNECLRWNFDNAYFTKPNSEGFCKIDKSSRTKRIDGADATIFAHKAVKILGIEKPEVDRDLETQVMDCPIEDLV